MELLKECGQDEILKQWETRSPEEQQRLAEQLRVLDKQYAPGLKKYVETGRSLLQQSQRGENPLEGWTPSKASGERLTFGTDEFHAAEVQGMEAIAETGFVLVAGGVGDRLGYPGIKVAIPSEVTTGTCYLGSYIEHILAFQARARRNTGNDKLQLPLAIMTSGDTHDRTEKLLADNANFGMADGQITLMRQEKVPCFKNSNGDFALNDDFTILTKPHGHGDVHSLLISTGTLQRFVDNGTKWVVFFQDTNGLVFRGLPSFLGVSKKNDFDVNSLTVPRRPGEAVGAICALENASEGRSITCNVEYNQLDALLKSSGEGGDVADDSGFSPYPGNINVLIFKAESYLAQMANNDAVPEFVNPKYKDDTKTVFKSPARVESMMQDYPKLLGEGAKVGFTQLERWICFSAVKNNVVDAAKKFSVTGIPESASTGEAAVYEVNRRLLRAAGCEITEEENLKEYAGVPTKVGARVVLKPSFGTTAKEIASKFSNGSQVTISSNSTLVLDGAHISVESLSLDGALTVRAAPPAKVTVRNLSVANKGFEFDLVDPNDEKVEPMYRIRGYKLGKKEWASAEYTDGGEHVLEDGGLTQSSSL